MEGASLITSLIRIQEAMVVSADTGRQEPEASQAVEDHTALNAPMGQPAEGMMPELVMSLGMLTSPR